MEVHKVLKTKQTEMITRLKKENENLNNEISRLIIQLEEAKGDKDLVEKKRNLDKAKEICDKTIAEYKSLIEELKKAKKAYEEIVRDMKLEKKRYEKEMAEAVKAYKEVTAR